MSARLFMALAVGTNLLGKNAGLLAMSFTVIFVPGTLSSKWSFLKT